MFRGMQAVEPTLMKILLAVDDSKYSQAAIEEVIRRPWPSDTQIRVLSVVHPLKFIVPVPSFLGQEAYYQSLDEERERASRDINKAAKEIRERAPELHVAVEALEGSPKKMIVEQAETWGADLIIVGSHGHGPVERFLLGSVAQSVVLHAPCSVEVVRMPQTC
jgi:nucleotide-binding universal stress UspA family protein